MPTEPVTILDADNARKDIACDDIGAQRYQLIKPTFGADGSATMVDAANGLPVAPATGSSWSMTGTVAVSNWPSTQVVSGSVAVTNFPATQPVSATALPLPSGAATSAKQDTIITTLGSPLQAGGTVVANLGTLNGAATSAKQDTGNTSLGSIDGKLPALASGRVPVDGSGVTQPVSGSVSVSNFPGTQPVSGTVTANLGTIAGVATETTLAALNTKTPALGAAAPSSSSPVVLPNDVVVGAAASIAALNIDLLTGNASGWYDAANFHSASIQIIGAAGISAGAIFFEQTNDTTNAAAGNFWPVEEETSLTPTPNIAAITIAASTTRMFRGQVTSRYVRVRVSTAFAGGNVQAVAVLSQLPYQRMVQTVHQATAANLSVTVGAALPTGGNTVGVVNLAPASGQGHSTQHRQALVANITTGVPTSVKASAAAIGSLSVANNCGVGIWFHVYNKASAPTMGTDTPVESFWCPTGANTDIPIPALSGRLTTGFAYAICDNCAAVPTAGGTITIASSAAAICVSSFYT